MNDNDGQQPPDPVSDGAGKGRAAGGRFAKGNAFSRGNPHAARVNRIRAELFRAIKPGDIKAAVEKLVEQAKGGDRFALSELLNRTIGTPNQADLLERIEALERAILERTP